MSDKNAYGATHRKKTTAWFAHLRDDLCRALEKIEDDAKGPTPESGRRPGRFKRKAWKRGDAEHEGGGGMASVMRQGRVFEKAGVNVSIVWGAFSKEFRD